VSYQKISKSLIFCAGIAVAVGRLLEEYNMVHGLKLVLFLLILVVPLPSFAEESSALTVATVGAHLYPHQDNESKFIAILEKGEKLQPLAKGVGNQAWYMVRTSKGINGWVQATDVSSGNRVEETFRDTGKIAVPKQRTDFLSECLDHADEKDVEEKLSDQRKRLRRRRTASCDSR
jgi:hypothetical protein